MENNINELIKEFQRIRKKGYIKSIRKGKGSVGLTLEKELGKEIEKSSLPDYKGIEIKAKKTSYAYDHYISLFNLGPDSYENAIKDIQQKYRYPDKDYKEFKVFGQNIYCNKYNYTAGKKFAYKLEIDKENKKVVFAVYNNRFKLIDNSISWSFDSIEKRLLEKLSYMAFISADRKYEYNQEYFKYVSMTIYKLKSFEEFLMQLKKEQIRVSFKIGIYKKGEHFGEIYNHGTAFCLNIKSLNKLFDEIYKE